MITIVSDLMKQLVRSGMEFMNPVETPFRFVENVGNSVGLRPAQGVDHILEFVSG